MRNKLLEKGAIYNELGDIKNLVSITVVSYFQDDINLSVSIINKEFIIENIPLTTLENDAQNQFGILLQRFNLILPETKYRQVEYERYTSIHAQLNVRTALQDSWSNVKNVFDEMVVNNNINSNDINQLAQVSYLLKMADAELCRIKSALISQNTNRESNSSNTASTQEQTVASHQQNIPSQLQDKNSHATDNEQQTEQSDAEFMRFVSELETFILNDRVARALDRKISDYFNATLTYNDEFLSSLASIYTNMRLNAVNSIKVQLDENREVISTLMKHVFGDMSDNAPENVYRGSSLLVLFYILIAQTGNIEIIKRQIQDNSALEGITTDEFANDLLFYYRKSV
ncbi:MAG: hypothetical protein HQL68_06115 [Magnetococcales bacterium]|nr:hypothetical protein [Magnetococcales bacterium]